MESLWVMRRVKREAGKYTFRPFRVSTAAGRCQKGDGGEEPKWRRDGRELFYLAPVGRLMAAEVKTDSGFESGLPVALFQTHPRQPLSAMDFFLTT